MHNGGGGYDPGDDWGDGDSDPSNPDHQQPPWKNVQNRIAQLLRAAGYSPGEARTFFSMLSTGADLIPIVGNIKSAIEGIVGFDLITGEKLSKWDRFLYVATAAIPGGGEVKAALKAGGKALREEKLVAHATEAIATTCGRCFEGGTMVETRAGPKKVEDVQVGDEVLSKDETDGTIAYKAVTSTFTRKADKIYRVGIGEQTISVTAEHPFYVHNIGWTRVENLKPGDRLDTRYGMTVEVKTLDAVEQPTQVYNFSVADYHSYFVTTLQIYTHNQGPCGSNGLAGTGKTSIPGQGYHNETYAPRAVKPQDATNKWDEFLGPGEHTNIHPRTGQPDPNRIVSQDGTRSIRYGDHEMNSSPTKHHYHEETWTYEPVNDVMNVDNSVVRVPNPKR